MSDCDILEIIKNLDVKDLKEKATILLDNSLKQIQRIAEEKRYILDGDSEIYLEAINQAKNTKNNINATSLIDATNWINDNRLKEYFRIQKEIKTKKSDFEVNRIFILSDNDINSNIVREIIKEQIDAGFNIKIASINKLSKIIPKLMKDFIIFDNERAIRIEVVYRQYVRGDLTYNEDDINELMSIFNELWNWSKAFE